jgi:RHS repeat-associated protein
VDAQNPTGYAQVLEERLSGNLVKSFTLGHDVIGQARIAGNAVTTDIFMYDGHGSTRALLTNAGEIVFANGINQRYTIDAYGNNIGFTNEQALTNHLYSGEWTDKTTGWNYNLSRYYDPKTGRWERMDDFTGNTDDPQSLHKYVYVHGDPIQGIDPLGEEFSLVGIGVSSSISGNMRGQSAAANVAAQARLSNAIRAFSQVYSRVEGAWDWINAARDAFDLFQFDPGDMRDLATALTGQLLKGVSFGGRITIPLPNAIYNKLSGILGPFKGTLENNVAQEWIGTLGAVLVGKALGFEATSVGTGYTGIDGILHHSQAGYVIVESKGTIHGSHRDCDGWLELHLRPSFSARLKSARQCWRWS